MTEFVFLNGPKGLTIINIDQIRHATQEANGVLHLHFGPGHELEVHGTNVEIVMKEINRRWSGRMKGQAA